MTEKEADDFWDAEFEKFSQEGRESSAEELPVKEYFDDNGTKYREGDRLLPDT